MTRQKNKDTRLELLMLNRRTKYNENEKITVYKN